MANRLRALGTQHETGIVTWLRAHGWPWAKRKTQAGSADEGDIWLSERIAFVIEAKSAKRTTDRMAVGTFLNELEAEINNAGARSGAVVFKQRGTTDVGKYVVFMRMEHLNVLLRDAYGDQAGVVKRRRRPG